MAQQNYAATVDGGQASAPVIIIHNGAQAPAQASMMKSLHRKELAKTLGQDTCWLMTCPCMCGGFGCVPITSRPVCTSDCKCLCIEYATYSQDVWNDEGLCVCLDKECCCVSHCGCPPGGGRNDGVPMFACCNQRFGGSEDGQAQTEHGKLMASTFLFYYCLCCGCGGAPCTDPLCLKSEKCLCYRTEGHSADCCPADRDCIFRKSKCCCYVTVCGCPSCFGGKPDGIPGCACCGKVLCLPASSTSEQQALIAPSQSQMP
jgi:hypothetical protein